jgi:hypothetical protein
MANKVFANNMEVACKAASGKSIAAFPDVCMTPPENPATPPGVPIPYPNTGMASDMTDGSKTVKISNKEIVLKNKSHFKKSSGDEAGSAAKKGVITSVNRGKVYFTAWSMDVKAEGANVVRHLDMTTHNHASAPGQTPPWPYADSMAMGSDPCEADKAAEETACGGKDRTQQCADAACQSAQACQMVPYVKSGSPRCCPGKTGHHLVEVNCFTEPGARGGIGEIVKMGKGDLTAALAAMGATLELAKAFSSGRTLPGFGNYNENRAPTVCADTSTGYTDHGAMHAVTERVKRTFARAEVLSVFGSDSSGKSITSKWTYGDARDAGVEAHLAVHPQCTAACSAAQLDHYHSQDPNGPQVDADDPVRTDTSQSYVQGRQWLTDNR